MEQGRTSLRGAVRGRFPGVSPGVLEADLLSALDRREIEVLFQPQFSCVTGAVVGAEALARWRHPTLGAIGARDLFAVAEKAALVAPLSRHVVARALEDAATWPESLTLSLNITPEELGDPRFAADFAALIGQSTIAPNRLMLEITEDLLLRNLAQAASALKALRGLPALGFAGCNVTIPHKVDTLRLVDRVEPLARRIGLQRMGVAIRQLGFGFAPWSPVVIVAVGLLAGALLRMVMGVLVDRLSPKKAAIIGQVIVIGALAYAWVAGVHSFNELLVLGVFLGVAGASFAAALPLASRWYPPEKQGTALGIFGAGKPERVKLFPGCTYAHPQVASIGLTEKAAKVKAAWLRIASPRAAPSATTPLTGERKRCSASSRAMRSRSIRCAAAWRWCSIPAPCSRSAATGAAPRSPRWRGSTAGRCS